MNDSAVGALARLTERRFGSFAEAADSVLEMLAAQLPPGQVAFAQFDRDDDAHRVVSSRSAGSPFVEPGSTLAPVPSAAFFESLSVGSYLAVPLEATNGSQVGELVALAREPGAYREPQAELLTVAARLLSLEWESVRSRAELRRLREALLDGATSDAVSGLPNRATFLVSLERAWHLERRGTVPSHLVVFELANLAKVGETLGEAVATLLLKDSAEALAGTVRLTDDVGRVGGTRLAAILVGCNGDAGAEAVIGRFRHALDGVTESRPARVSIAPGILSLAATGSPEESLRIAEERAGRAAVSETGPAGGLAAVPGL